MHKKYTKVGGGENRTHTALESLRLLRVLGMPKKSRNPLRPLGFRIFKKKPNSQAKVPNSQAKVPNSQAKVLYETSVSFFEALFIHFFVHKRSCVRVFGPKKRPSKDSLSTLLFLTGRDGFLPCHGLLVRFTPCFLTLSQPVKSLNRVGRPLKGEGRLCQTVKSATAF